MNKLNISQLFVQLREKGHLSQEQEDLFKSASPVALSSPSSSPSAPYYIQILLGIGGWMAASFLVLFLTLMEVAKSGIGMITCGFILMAAGFFLKIKGRDKIFLDQLSLAFCIAGQIMFLIGIAESSRSFVSFCLGTVILEVILFVIYPDSIQKFIAPILAILAVLGIVYDCDIYYMVHSLSGMVALATVFLWLKESSWISRKLRNWAHPLGYGLAASLMGILVCSADWGKGVTKISFWWPTTALLGGVFFYLEYKILESRSALKMLPQVLAGTVIICTSTHQAPGITASLLILILSHHCRNIILKVSSLSFIAYYVSVYYYDLSLTLLTKSMVLMGTGILLLVLRSGLCLQWGLSSQSPSPEKETIPQRDPVYAHPVRIFLAVVGLFIALTVPAYQTYQKEKTLQEGTPLFLELAPVDPRSLMQGDYMALRYGISRDFDLDKYKNIPLDKLETKGFFVISLDKKGVAKIERLHDPSRAPGKGEYLLKYRKRNYSVRIAAESFFFQEGDAQFYEGARYGEFRLNSSGDCLLVGLRGQNLEKLGPGEKK